MGELHLIACSVIYGHTCSNITLLLRVPQPTILAVNNQPQSQKSPAGGMHTLGCLGARVNKLECLDDDKTDSQVKFRSGTHGLNEELCSHREREGMKECLLCDDECESVSHVLWECQAL